MPRWLILVPLLAGCDDTVFVPGEGPRTYAADWPGMTAFIDDNCASCHGGGTLPVLPADLEADVRNATGFYVVAGNPDESLIWRVVSNELREGDYAVMPLGAQLPPMSVAHVEAWIAAGASLEAPPDTGTPDSDTDP